MQRPLQTDQEVSVVEEGDRCTKLNGCTHRSAQTEGQAFVDAKTKGNQKAK